jgi:CheY-like chemotaxis protein
MRTILVVDDEEEIRELVAKMLRYGGFDVLEAASGAQAAQVYADCGAVDLVVTDVVMAEETGPELAERLRQESPDLKVLYISGSPQLRQELAEQTAFLPKPFTIAEIVGSVSDLLTR